MEQSHPDKLPVKEQQREHFKKFVEFLHEQGDTPAAPAKIPEDTPANS